MYLKSLELSGFKSFAKKSELEFSAGTTAIVGPNGSGKSNIAEAFRFVLGEQSMKSMRGKKGEDLIWGGSPSAPRSSRASVKVVFDNHDRALDIDYDEVSIERTVHRDGVNEYAINGSSVRLKDVVELLAGANIGASGHHIISQGEADRILSASARERREMIEDALALKVYQYKKNESQKKLEKTRENIKQVESLRKEIQPHLKFLEKQVKKIEQSKELRDELLERYLEYFKREDAYLSHERRAIEAAEKAPKEEHDQLEEELAKAKETLAQATEGDEKGQEVLELENKLADVRKKKDEHTRELGRLEGQIAAVERVAKQGREGSATVARSDVEGVVEELESLQSDDSLDVSMLRKRLADVVAKIRSVLSSGGSETEDDQELAELKEKRQSLESEMKELEEEERSLEKSYAALKEGIESERDKERTAEREVFRISSRLAELRTQLNELKHRRERFELESDEFKRELGEAVPLVGRAVTEYKDHPVKVDGVELPAEALIEENRKEQEERKRTAERMKIRLEELAGGGSEEILKEHEEVKNRDEFLERELEDLDRSAESLLKLIEELDEKLDTKFKEGLTKINKEFQTFFALMFGGGSASLSVVKQERRRRRSSIEDEESEPEEDAPVEEGIDISISLPHKRIKGLEMLSGGERALTSIALIFAMSQVNPPPFLILDETDAALDEANSRRYGDMIDNLSQKSQLILVTHNRETMSRAGILYGVTMGGDGISKLLSVKFEEAVSVAK